MSFKRVSPAERRETQKIVERCWAVGLTEATFSQVLKDPAGWNAAAEREAAERAQEAIIQEAIIQEAVEKEAVEKEATQFSAQEIIATLRGLGRTVKQIAIAVGVHVSTVYRWARGIFKPLASRLGMLASI